ncbi:MAG: hypothetical protein EBT70_13640 [Betaproteobacteria bacterium]|nr:hypothetical protein [Betaproteobacteria bacterium]
MRTKAMGASLKPTRPMPSAQALNATSPMHRAGQVKKAPQREAAKERNFDRVKAAWHQRKPMQLAK